MIEPMRPLKISFSINHHVKLAKHLVDQISFEKDPLDPYLLLQEPGKSSPCFD